MKKYTNIENINESINKISKKILSITTCTVFVTVLIKGRYHRAN